MLTMGLFSMFNRTDKKTDALMDKARSIAAENDRATTRLEVTVKRLLDAQRGNSDSVEIHLK